MKQPLIDGRDTAGRFVPGNGFNPNGKRPGTRNRASALLDRMAEKGAAAVMTAVLTAAKNGDISAATLLLSRLWPPRKGRPIRFELPDLLQPGDAPAALAEIARMTAAGVVSPEKGAEVARIVETYMRASDVTELMPELKSWRTPLLLLPPRTIARVARLEQLFAALVEPPAESFGGVVIYDPKDGPWSPPANAPEGTVWVLIPDNGRDRYAIPEGFEEPLPIAAREPETEELPWRREIF